MSTIQRRGLTKVPTGDVVSEILRSPSEEPTPRLHALESISSPMEPPVRARRGRPRSRRRMEPFSSKIDTDLRDALDEHIAKTGETIVDILDRGLRAALRSPH